MERMRIDISYTSRKYYNRSNILQWVWTYKPYIFVEGFILRIFGVYINVREDNATDKLIKLFKASGR